MSWRSGRPVRDHGGDGGRDLLVLEGFPALLLQQRGEQGLQLLPDPQQEVPGRLLERLAAGALQPFLFMPGVGQQGVRLRPGGGHDPVGLRPGLPEQRFALQADLVHAVAMDGIDQFLQLHIGYVFGFHA